MAGWHLNRSRKILIFRTGQLGDTIVSLPAIRAIRAAYPHHELIFMTAQQSTRDLVPPWTLLRSTGLFSRVVHYVPALEGIHSWLLLLRLVLQIRLMQPEMLIYLRDVQWHQTKRDRLFFRVLCGISQCYGLEDEQHLFGERDVSGRLVRFPPEADWLLQVVEKAGMPVPFPGEAKFGLPISSLERLRIDALWREMNIPHDAVVIALCPGSKMPAKRWPLERFITVAHSLVAEVPGCILVLLGGPEDEGLGQTIKFAVGESVITVAGRLTILETAETLSRCRAYVGNDTGVMHLAAAVGTPCVAIFSARDHPGRWEPNGQGHVVLRKDPPCAGCLLTECVERDMVCLKDIHVNEVMDAIRSVLASEPWLPSSVASGLAMTGRMVGKQHGDVD